MRQPPLLTTIANFDPVQAPILPRDERFKALATQSVDVAFLIKKLAPSLSPGLAKDAPLKVPKNASLKSSAVLIPIMCRPQGLTLLLTVRSAKLRKHSGQIALPGGKIDAADANAIAAALREAEEEVGLPKANCQVIGAMPALETGTGFEITPIAALVNCHYPSPFTPVPSEDEVSDIFEVPLSHILNPINHNHHALSWTTDEGVQTRDWYAIPSTDFTGRERHIWGVTARILRNFYEYLHGEPA